MNELRTILFEDPIAVYVTCGSIVLLVAAAAIVLHRPRVLVAAAVPVAAAVAAGVLAAVVTTDRERLNEAAHALVAAVAAGDRASVDGWIADDYDDGVYRKPAVLGRLDEVRRVWGLEAVDLSAVEVNAAGDSALVAVRAVARFEKSPSIYNIRSAVTRWQLWWSRREGRWQLTSSRLVEPSGCPGAPAGP
ncbi:MAG: hypothetical protein GX591_05065 [Planctomycetes bacterium]|nr:hypothetical protein [Planctomycetota bacterium]